MTGMNRATLTDAVWGVAGIVPSFAIVLWIIDAEHGLALPSLGSTATLLFGCPAHEGSRPLAVIASHLLGGSHRHRPAAAVRRHWMADGRRRRAGIGRGRGRERGGDYGEI